MPISINFSDFDTVCYSKQHNIIQLINKSVGIGIEINLHAGQISKLEGDVTTLTTTTNQLAGTVNSLTLNVNSVSRDLEKLTSDFNVFSYAVNEDIKTCQSDISDIVNMGDWMMRRKLGRYLDELDQRIAALGG